MRFAAHCGRHDNAPAIDKFQALRDRLVEIIDMRHELVKLAALIDWEFFKQSEG